jgi:hypothetical protein
MLSFFLSIDNLSYDVKKIIESAVTFLLAGLVDTRSILFGFDVSGDYGQVLQTKIALVLTLHPVFEGK